MELQEKAGIHEFDNSLYRKKIKEISAEIKNSALSGNVQIKGLNGNFTVFSYDDLYVNWLQHLDIYVAKSFGRFDALSPTDNYAEELGLYKKAKDTVEKGSIIIYDNGRTPLLPVIFHELLHIFDSLKYDNLWWEDEYYHFDHIDHMNFSKYKILVDSKSLNADDIYKVIVRMMYNANYLESMAFMENINFEIYRFVESLGRNINRVDKEKTFYAIPGFIQDILLFKKYVDLLKTVDLEIKNSYNVKYRDELKVSYKTFHSLDSVLTFMEKNFKKMISHAKTLYNYYFDLQFSTIGSQMLKPCFESFAFHNKSYDEDFLKRFNASSSELNINETLQIEKFLRLYDINYPEQITYLQEQLSEHLDENSIEFALIDAFLNEKLKNFQTF